MAIPALSRIHLTRLAENKVNRYATSPQQQQLSGVNKRACKVAEVIRPQASSHRPSFRRGLRGRQRVLDRLRPSPHPGFLGVKNRRLRPASFSARPSARLAYAGGQCPPCPLPTSSASSSAPAPPFPLNGDPKPRGPRLHRAGAPESRDRRPPRRRLGGRIPLCGHRVVRVEPAHLETPGREARLQRLLRLCGRRVQNATELLRFRYRLQCRFRHRFRFFRFRFRVTRYCLLCAASASAANERNFCRQGLGVRFRRGENWLDTALPEGLPRGLTDAGDRDGGLSRACPAGEEHLGRLGGGYRDVCEARVGQGGG